MDKWREDLGRKRALRPIESFGIGRIITDSDFRVTEISEESARLLGGEPEQLLSRELSKDFGPRREILEQAAAGTIQLSECRTADGNTANACFRVLKLDGTQPEGYDVLFLKESSELKCSGSESVHFQEVMSGLSDNQAYTAFLDKLLESAGHDLKTPLGVVLGYCELLIKSKANSNSIDQERIHKTIYRNCAWISEMVEKLEDYASLVRRSKEERREIVNLAGALKETTERLSRTAFANQIKLNVESRGDIKVMAPPAIVAAMLDELLKNSILYCKKERELSIAVSREKGRPRVTVDIPSLEDDSPSFNHLVDRLFTQPPDFHKEQRETKPFCLGLGAVKSLAVMLGGAMSAIKGSDDRAQFILEFASFE
jgi:K+-sensing histidine kinase KdpD